ncbi:MAG: DUF4396 domain-containing protein [Actinobacteria bacterium]|nr:DUF4396 domain-containing protein [Actinomycetota bacterium]
MQSDSSPSGISIIRSVARRARDSTGLEDPQGASYAKTWSLAVPRSRPSLVAGGPSNRPSRHPTRHTLDTIYTLGGYRQTIGGPVSTHAHANADHSSLDRLAVAATLHCLTGCAIGELLGMVIATALGWGNGAQMALAIGLAYVFGFGLTALPLVRAGLGPRRVITTALAADTVSITIMEVFDNLTVLAIPSAMEAGLTDPLFYGAIAAGFVVAFPFAFLANRHLIARGRGHAVVHAYH